MFEYYLACTGNVISDVHGNTTSHSLLQPFLGLEESTWNSVYPSILSSASLWFLSHVSVRPMHNCLSMLKISFTHDTLLGTVCGNSPCMFINVKQLNKFEEDCPLQNCVLLIVALIDPPRFALVLGSEHSLVAG